VISNTAEDWSGWEPCSQRGSGVQRWAVLGGCLQ